MTEEQQQTFDALNADCWRFQAMALRSGTLEAAELYARHLDLMETYLRDERVLH